MKAALGLEGRSVDLPSHIAFFNRDEAQLRERQAGLLRPAVEGKREGILFFGPSGAAETLYRHLETDLRIDLSKRREDGLVMLGEGDTDADQQLENVMRPIEAMIARGAKVVRAIGRAQWGGSNWPVPEDFVWFESRLNEALAHLPVLAFCAYDIFEIPGPGLILAGVRSHPSILCGTLGLRNEVFEPHRRHLQLRMVEFPWLTEVEPAAE
jgi:hypothetical protein